MKCDVTSNDDVNAAFDAVEAEFGGTVEVLVSNAGITNDGLLLRMSEDDFTSVIDANLTAAYRVTKRAARGMLKARTGRIILMSSVVALLGQAGQANYAASKAGLVGLARSLARELGSRSITVNVIAPGPVATDMTAALSDDLLAAMTSAVPLGRVATPDEIAGVAYFLASPDAAVHHRRCHPRGWRLGYGTLTRVLHSGTTYKEKTVDQALFARFRKCAVEVLSVEESAVVPEANFGDDLDADSLDLVELVMALEEEFDISVPEEELEGVETVQQAYDLVANKL